MQIYKIIQLIPVDSIQLMPEKKAIQSWPVENWGKGCKYKFWFDLIEYSFNTQNHQEGVLYFFWAEKKNLAVHQTDNWTI